MAENNEVMNNEEMMDVETVNTENVGIIDKAAYIGGLLALGYAVCRGIKFVWKKVGKPHFKKQDDEVVVDVEVYDGEETE